MRKEEVKATFFCTTNFAQNAPEIVRQIVEEGHELASHGCDHWSPSENDIERSKQILQSIGGVEIHGYRQPRMLPVSYEALKNAGYSYDASLHPTVIPGRYMNYDLPRIPFKKSGVLEIPTTVTPWLRLPLFWLAFHNYPWWIYKILCKWTYKYDGLFVIYFHPWEFVDLNGHPEWNIPWIIRRNSGSEMIRRISDFINTFKKHPKGNGFSKMRDVKISQS